MESLLNPRQIAACQPEPVKAPGPTTIVDMVNDISDDSTISVMTGESGGQTAATHDSLATRSLEQDTATLEDLAQVVTTRLAPTAEIPEGPVPTPIIPVVVKPRETGTMLESIHTCSSSAQGARVPTYDTHRYGTQSGEERSKQ